MKAFLELQLAVLLAMLFIIAGCGGTSAKTTAIAAERGNMQSDNNKNQSLTDSHYILEPSTSPPSGLTPDEVPMFIVFGDDDNGYSGLDSDGNLKKGSGGTAWLVDIFKDIKNPIGNSNPATFDGAPAHFSMMGLTEYITWEKRVECKRAWRMAYESGHEIGNHTATHPHGDKASIEDWTREINTATSDMTKPWNSQNPDDLNGGIGLKKDEIIGFRSPYLQYNENLFKVLEQNGFKYDCSIEEGYDDKFDGRNFNWPYTLHNGTPANSTIDKHPSIVEIPVYPFMVPPDEECEKYGVQKGFRLSLKEREKGPQFQKDHDHDYIHMEDGRIRGLDYDLWQEYNMTANEFTATLKYTLDQRLKSNRAPMTVCMHTDFYVNKPWDEDYGVESDVARQAAIQDFLDYASSIPQVRIVSNRELLSWLLNPSKL
ncbi:MAG: polysaccharide deacetylase family protein [Deltaproteobacteria bacterium]|nr:polysaccharide deacetylase family protein [Deltaproteobacteria bacterium]